MDRVACPCILLQILADGLEGIPFLVCGCPAPQQIARSWPEAESLISAIHGSRGILFQESADKYFCQLAQACLQAARRD